MASYNKFESFVEALAEKKHDLATDQLKIALCNVAPVVTNGVLADLTEIAYTHLSTRNVVTTSSAQSGGPYKLTLTDLVLTASGGDVGPFRYVVIYNDTAVNDELVAFFDYGSSVSINDTESLTLDFDGAAGVLTNA